MQALGITVTLNSLIQNLDFKRLQKEGSSIMSQMLIDERWEGIAFIALYDEKGKVYLHSNPALIGKNFDEIKSFFKEDSPYYHKILLKTGEEVFVSDTKIKISNNIYLLRVALHTYPAETLLRTAKTHLFFISTAVILIILAGLVSILMMDKIEKMQLKLKELEKVSMLSRVLVHEIRNPLGSIKGFAQYLIKKIEEPTLLSYMEIILKESLRIERLSNEISDYANPHATTVTEVNLKELFSEIILPFMNQKEILINVNTEEIFLKTDRDKLKQIISNILQNAVDALEDSKDKMIFIDAKKKGKAVRLEIRDTGVGMDEYTLQRATEAFFTTKPKGTGLGLAIVSRLCEILKIDIKIMSKEKEGTTVCLTIPESL